MSRGPSTQGVAGTTSERQVVSCRACGAPVAELDLARPDLRCRHCGTPVVVPEAVRRRALAYLSNIRLEEERLAAAVRAEASAEQASELVKKNRYGLWFMFAMVAAVPLAASGLTVGLPLLGIDDPLRGDLVYGCTVFLVLAAVVIFFVLAYQKTHATSGGLPNLAAPPPALTVPCQSCGARIAFEPGEASKPCAYCGIANVAPSGVATPMVQWATAKARAAEDAQAWSEKQAQADLVRAEIIGNRVTSVGQFVAKIAPGVFFLVMGSAFFLQGSRAERRGALVSVAIGVAWLVARALGALLKRPT